MVEQKHDEWRGLIKELPAIAEIALGFKDKTWLKIAKTMSPRKR
jgi:hypothetical protein